MTDPRLASWGARVSAALLDGLIVWVLLLLVAVFTHELGPAEPLLMLAALCAYYAGTMVRPGKHNGQSLGKQACGIRVVRDDGRPLTIGSSLLREAVAKPVAGLATLGVDFLWPLGEGQNRALHDLAVHTHVVQTHPAPPPLGYAPPPRALAPPIARHVYAAQVIEGRIVETVRHARLPYGDVCVEVSSLVALVRSSAQRAQLLYDALTERPVASIERRLAELEGSGKTDLIEALDTQLAVARRMWAQLERYEDNLERVVIELDTIRGNLLSMSASTDSDNQERLAERVRALRDEMGFVAEGVSEAYG